MVERPGDEIAIGRHDPHHGIGGRGLTLAATQDNPNQVQPLTGFDLSHPGSFQLEAHSIAWVVCGVAAIIASFISFYTIFKHLRNFNKPLEQVQIVRILLIVPIYSGISWFAFRFYTKAVYYFTIRDCYEAFVIYSFFSLIMLYLGETAHVQRMALIGKQKMAFPMTFGMMKYNPDSNTFLRNIRVLVLQYVVMKPLTTALAVIMQLNSHFCAESMSPKYGHFWYMIINVISVSASMYGLLVVYFTIKDEIAEKKPLPKFISIKFVILFCMWQNVILSTLAHYDIIRGTSYWTPTNVANGINSMLVCFEMLIASVIHLYAFNSSEYHVRDKRTSWIKALGRSLNPLDIFRDIKRGGQHVWRTASLQNTVGRMGTNNRRDVKSAAVKDEHDDYLQNRQELRMEEGGGAGSGYLATVAPLLDAKPWPVDPSDQNGVAVDHPAMAAGLVRREGGTEHLSPGSPIFYIQIALIIILVLIGGLVAGLTLGLMSLDETDLRILKNSGTPAEKIAAERIEPIRKRGHLLLVTLLLTNTVINETLPILLDGGIIPQAVCSRYGLQIGSYFSWFVKIIMLLLFVISWPISKLLDWMLGENEVLYKRRELKELIKLHGKTEGGDLHVDEVTILNGALSLETKTVRTIMTRLENVFMLPSDAKLDRPTLGRILSAGHSRIPVHDVEDPTKIVGILLVKTIILNDPDDAKPIMSQRLLSAPSASETTNLFDILNVFQVGASHMAIVKDANGVASGIVTLEDVIEEIIQVSFPPHAFSVLHIAYIMFKLQEEIVDETDVLVDSNNPNSMVRSRAAPLLTTTVQALHSVMLASSSSSTTSTTTSTSVAFSGNPNAGAGGTHSHSFTPQPQPGVLVPGPARSPLSQGAQPVKPQARKKKFSSRNNTFNCADGSSVGGNSPLLYSSVPKNTQAADVQVKVVLTDAGEGSGSRPGSRPGSPVREGTPESTNMGGVDSFPEETMVVPSDARGPESRVDDADRDSVVPLEPDPFMQANGHGHKGHNEGDV
ncbi:hypothetical protein HK101_011254 [Irineochytrium annulatum]|nr:hypothetical protein HK101_011254 [Irineochytrium annulatum]